LDPAPAMMVTCPAARAVRTGGSSVDRLTTFGLLDVQVSPVTDCPAAPSAFANYAIGYCPGFPGFPFSSPMLFGWRRPSDLVSQSFSRHPL
jgi:hypothetical protein